MRPCLGEARGKVQFVRMYAGHPHFCIKAVPLAEIHQLQVRLKREVIVEQLFCLNVMSKTKVIFVLF